MRKISLIVFFLVFYSNIFSQTVVFSGVIKDEQTLKPIRDVNIKVYGTALGTSTDQNGNFSLNFNKIPATLIFSCVGYELASHTITAISEKPIEFQLRPKAYLLQEVKISSKKYSYLFKDNDYSVLDYEITGDNLVLLVFKYQLKKSELVLLSRSGDTLAFSPLPEVPPVKLFKDFLTNIYYISKAENAFQFLYNERNNRIEYYHGKAVDSLQAFINPFIFKISDRLYFQEQLAGGFGTAFGYFEKGTGKKYIRKYLNDAKISERIDDQTFYNKWNNLLGKNYLLESDDIESELAFDFSISRREGGGFGKNEARAHQFEFYKMIYPVVRTNDDNIAFFNFATDTIELMNKDGNLIYKSAITFHKKSSSNSDPAGPVKLSNPDWRWGCSILVDEYSREVYTSFLRNGMVKVQRIDLETGNLKNGTVLPFPFPEKIEIYKGDAYFLIKRDGTNDKWKLIKCKI